jgi:hypothetical protein
VRSKDETIDVDDQFADLSEHGIPIKPSCLALPDVRRKSRQVWRLTDFGSGGKVYGRGGAAELLGLKPTTLLSRIRAFGIRN